MKPTPAVNSEGVSAMKPLNAPLQEEIDRVEAFLRKHMYPETLEAFLQEKTRTFRRTSTPTPTTAVPAYVPVAVTSPMSSSSSDVHDPNHANCCWTCIVCEKIFTKKGSAKRHCDTAHLEETAAERVECPQCLQKFNRRDDLYAHIRRIHHTTGGEQLVQELIHTSSLHRRQPKRTKKTPLLAQQQQLPSPLSVSMVTHQEHVDCVLPSGGVICPPGMITSHGGGPMGVPCLQHAHPLAHGENNTCENASAASAAVLEETHFRVLHDGHEDVIVNGTLQHYNDQAGVWENHGELSGFEYDLDFLAGRYEDQDLWDEEVKQVRQDAGGMMTLPQGSTLIKAKPQDCCPRHHVCEAAPTELLANHDSVAISNMLEAMRNNPTSNLA